MSKLKSIMNNRTHGHLGEQRKTCSDCVHVMPGIRGDEVTCEYIPLNISNIMCVGKMHFHPMRLMTAIFIN